jgi:hypothetical protein
MTPLRQKLIDAGFATNEFLLDLNDCLEDPAPRYPRSRMFRWPVHVDRHEDRLTVCHQLMMFEPFVQRVMVTGQLVEIEPEPAGCHGIHHHAVDLADDIGWRDLIATAHYVTPPVIMRGVVIGAMAGRLSTVAARAVLDTLDAPEPDDRSAANLSHGAGLLKPAFIDNGAGSGKGNAGKGKWAINLHGRRRPVDEVWAAIHGIEDGWFKRDKYGYFWMSDVGLSRHMGVPLP